MLAVRLCPEITEPENGFVVIRWLRANDSGIDQLIQQVTFIIIDRSYFKDSNAIQC